mgnify:FL=1
MKKSKKILLAIIPVVLVLLVVSTNVFAVSDMFDIKSLDTAVSGGSASTNATNAVQGIWKTVLLILQILAVAAIVIAGVRYMFASADAKADIKKQTITLVVGAVLVFGASGIINMITSISNDLTSTTTPSQGQ